MNNHATNRESSFWILPAIFFLCTGIAGFVSMVASGIELLNMPTWAWAFCGLTVTSTIILYALNVRNGNRAEVETLTLQIGAILIALLVLLFAFGVRGDAPLTDALINTDKLLNDIVHAMAWFALLIAPTIALGFNGFVWQSHARETQVQ